MKLFRSEVVLTLLLSTTTVALGCGDEMVASDPPSRDAGLTVSPDAGQGVFVPRIGTWTGNVSLSNGQEVEVCFNIAANRESLDSFESGCLQEDDRGNELPHSLLVRGPMSDECPTGVQLEAMGRVAISLQTGVTYVGGNNIEFSLDFVSNDRAEGTLVQITMPSCDLSWSATPIQ